MTQRLTRCAVQPDRDDETLAQILDFATTILKLTGAKNPGDLPGLDLMDHEALKARKIVFVEAYPTTSRIWPIHQKAASPMW